MSQNFVTPLWSSKNSLTCTANSKANAADQGCYCYLSDFAFVSAQAICSDCSSNGIFQRASETLTLIGSAVGQGTSEQFMPLIAATQCCYLMCSVLSGLEFTANWTYSPVHWKTVPLLEDSCPLLYSVVIFVMVFESCLVPVADSSCFFCYILLYLIIVPVQFLLWKSESDLHSHWRCFDK